MSESAQTPVQVKPFPGLTVEQLNSMPLVDASEANSPVVLLAYDKSNPPQLVRVAPNALGAAPAGLGDAASQAVLAGRRTTSRHRVGFIGDSITAAGYQFSATIEPPIGNSNSPATWCMAQADGRFTLIQSAGIGGETAAQINARLQSQIIDVGCDIAVAYSYFWNTANPDTTATELRSMADKCVAADVLLVICGPTPDYSLSPNATRISACNRMRRMAAEIASVYQLPYVDLWSVLGDPATGMLKAAYVDVTNDVHPNSAGRKAGGEAVAAALKEYLKTDMDGLNGLLDSNDLLSGYGIFAADANADGLSDGWTLAANPAGSVRTRDTDAALGPIQRVTSTATASTFQAYRDFNTTAGNLYEVTGYIHKTGTAYGQISLNATGGNVSVTFGSGLETLNLREGRVSTRWRALSGVTSTRCTIVVGPGTGVVDFANIAIRDLTALGLE